MVVLALLPTTAEAADVLFTQTNAPGGENAVQVMVTDDEARLQLLGTVPTGGSGTGKEIESQGTLAFSRRRLLVLDAGSATITAFRLAHGRLVRTAHLTDRRRSAGVGRRRRRARRRPEHRREAAPDPLRPDRQGQARPPQAAGVRLAQKAGAYAIALSPSGRRAAVTYADAPAAKAVERFALGAKRTRSAGFMPSGGPATSPVAFTGEKTVLLGH